MIDIRIAIQEDHEKWNDFVFNSYNGTIYHTWDWLTVVKNGLADEIYPLIAEENNKIVGVFPLVLRSNFKFHKVFRHFSPIRNLFQTLWSNNIQTWGYGGPILNKPDNSITDAFLDYLEKLVKSNWHILGYRIFPYDNTIFDRSMSQYELRKIEWQTAYVDLTPSIEVLSSKLKKQHRTAINNAQKRGVLIREVRDEKELKELFDIIWKDLVRRLINEDPKQLIYSPKYLNFRYFKLILSELVSKQFAKIYFAEHDTKKIAFIVILFYKTKMYYQHGAYLREYSSFNANNLLVWNAICNGKQRGFETFDLAGMPLDKNDGVFKFKNGWGGEIKKVYWYYRDIRYNGLRRIKNKIFSYL